MVYRGEISFVRLLAALVAGIMLARFAASRYLYEVSDFLVLFLFAGMIGLQAFYTKRSVYLNSWLGGLMVYIVFAALGYFLSLHSQPRYSADYFARQASDALVLVVRSEPQRSNSLMRFEAEASHVVQAGRVLRSSGRLMVSVENGGNYRYGDRLLVPGLYRETEPPRNPAEFDYRSYLLNRSVTHQAYFDAGQVRLIGRNGANRMYGFALSVRDEMIAVFKQYLQPESAALMSTLLLGYRASMSMEQVSAFTNTGTLHVLSVSGMHVGILAILLGIIFLPLKSTGKLHWVYPVSIILFIWCYALITGLSAPACRASLMITCVLIGKSLARRQNSYNLVAISAFLLLLYNPLFLFDVGFQLSYLAVLGLVYLYPRVYGLLYFKNYAAEQVWSYSALSVAAQAATLPLSLYYFHQLPVYFLPANLFLALPVMLVMLLGILMAVPVDAFRHILAWVLDHTIAFTQAGLSEIEALPYATVGAIWPGMPELILAGMLIYLFARFWETRRVVVLFTFLATLFILVSSASWRGVENYRSRQVVFFSLRKDNPIAVIDNGKATVFTGLSADDRNIRFSVQPYLDRSGIRQEEWVHPDSHYRSQSLANNRHYISFGSWNLIRYGRDTYLPDRNLSADVLLITGNPIADVEAIAGRIEFGLLLIDASNTDRNISRWAEQAEKMKIPCYILKRNDAYIVDLSHQP